MAKQKEITTRDKILQTAAKMFSERGYDRVTTREIAKAIGINAASIYYYFPSKEDILRSLYSVYSEHLQKDNPNLDELLRLAETDPPHEVLMKSEFHFNDEEIREMLDQIILIATQRFGISPESELFIRENIFDNIVNILRPLLFRLIELRKIKPFDVNGFLTVLSYYCFSAAALHKSHFRQSIAEYQAGMSFLFSMITPTDE